MTSAARYRERSIQLFLSRFLRPASASLEMGQ